MFGVGKVISPPIAKTGLFDGVGNFSSADVIHAHCYFPVMEETSF